LTRSVFVAEVTQVKGFLLIPYSRYRKTGSLTRLHEVSGVKVPRPASPFMTHETPILFGGMAVAVSRGKMRDKIGIAIYSLAV
jgi:hypothetical protein